MAGKEPLSRKQLEQEALESIRKLMSGPDSAPEQQQQKKVQWQSMTAQQQQALTPGQQRAAASFATLRALSPTPPQQTQTQAKKTKAAKAKTKAQQQQQRPQTHSTPNAAAAAIPYNFRASTASTAAALAASASAQQQREPTASSGDEDDDEGASAADTDVRSGAEALVSSGAVLRRMEEVLALRGCDVHLPHEERSGGGGGGSRDALAEVMARAIVWRLRGVLDEVADAAQHRQRATYEHRCATDGAAALAPAPADPAALLDALRAREAEERRVQDARAEQQQRATAALQQQQQSQQLQMQQQQQQAAEEAKRRADAIASMHTAGANEAAMRALGIVRPSFASVAAASAATRAQQQQQMQEKAAAEEAERRMAMENEARAAAASGTRLITLRDCEFCRRTLGHHVLLKFQIRRNFRRQRAALAIKQ